MVYDFASNVVKGRIAETLVEEMFKKSGYMVYRFGYEAILENLSQNRRELQESDTLEKIKSIPDFLVVSPNGSVQLIEVKYSGSGSIQKSKLNKYAEFWKEARILLVIPDKPHFKINYIENFLKTEKMFPLENDRYTKIDSKIIERFSEVVKQYFKE
ncbi:hypothetical protein HYX04_02025 [Candidatus Woesearchaeota archaeon]|nr:hypothetical protein [Candidatus Woesearchaeota archaeon]